MALEHRQYILVGPGTEINNGFHEDSDSYIAVADTLLAVLGPRKNGAIPVQIVDNGELCPELLYLHQPEPMKYPKTLANLAS